MAHNSSQAPLQRRRDLDVVKQQLVFLVSTIAAVFVLCPECLQFYRNLCVIPLLAWLTATAFDTVIILNDAWDNAPTMVKFFIPIDFPEITPPFEQIRCSANKGMAIARIKLGQFLTEMRPLLLALVDWLMGQTGRGPSNSNSPESQLKTPQHAPKPDQWVAILVTTPPVYDYDPFSFGPHTTKDIHKIISWESSDESSIPAILSSSDFQVQLSLCVIPRSIWNSSKSILEKFMTGFYWYHQQGHAVCAGGQWDEERIRTISQVQAIGYMAGHNTFSEVNEYFNSLRKGWDDIDIFWNNVDFTIILSFLLVGTSSTDICKKMFDQFASLRLEQAHRNKDMNRAQLGAGAAIFTLLTGGLAAPLTIPMMMGVEAAEKTMSRRDRFLWGERLSACQNLLSRFEKLSAIIELEDTEVYAPKASFSPAAIEASWFVDDAW
ncbi:hypothetical protein FSARC_11877 [Fusarium sarcochroum]|uniref:Uncharacterized protein n=1 Tax=Fusarium sarcochroum TaxID=1208366 RepID=A0A8H4TCF0_9HYPO|nr:hypothetical protein FSARC_11877 [Fusarium sarcochroum]